MSVYEVANRFIEIYNNKNENLSHKKLQKLVYLAYGFYLVFENKKLFDEKFEAWAKENTQAHNFLIEYSKFNITTKKEPQEGFYKYIFDEYFLNLDEYKGLRLLCDKNIELTQNRIQAFLKENKCLTKKIDTRIYLYLDTK